MQQGDLRSVIGSNFTGSPRMAAMGGRRRVCVSAWTPFVSCEVGSTRQQDYSGFMVRPLEAVLRACEIPPLACSIATSGFEGCY